jgi:hypothetical protein
MADHHFDEERPMNLEDRRIVIASPRDRERLVAELWSQGEMWAEVNQEKNDLEIEIYPSKSGRPWQFSLAQLERTLEEAKQKLATR